MKKSYLILAAAALFAACSSDDSPTAPEQNQAYTKGEVPVAFDSYVNRGITRAGQSGDQTTATLQAATSTLATSEGFGVFAYFTGNNPYDQLCTPNFMYNQKVWYNSTTTAFEYSPIKYWPNEYGTTAISDDVDKVSFFAYAPYVQVAPQTGKVVEDATTGITGMNRNSSTGDPLVKYVASFDDISKSVDLCWGVYNETGWTIQQTSTSQSPALVAGKPWLDVQRPDDATSAQKLKFTFLHALAKLNVTIDTYVDGTAAANLTEPALTKVYVRSISFSGMATKGALNLNNTNANKPYWMDYAGTNDLVADDEITFYDGRKDGKEGIAGALATNEKTLGLNPVIISDDGNTQNGVTGSAVNLFRKMSSTPGTYEAAGVNDAVYFIPTEEEVNVTIVYDIETKDSNLPNLISDGISYGSSIENRITKKITFTSGSKFEAGKSYTLQLHLGLNSVKFNAEVSPWTDESAQDVNLPAN